LARGVALIDEGYGNNTVLRRGITGLGVIHAARDC
jgi:hypothetical protein